MDWRTFVVFLVIFLILLAALFYIWSEPNCVNNGKNVSGTQPPTSSGSAGSSSNGIMNFLGIKPSAAAAAAAAGQSEQPVATSNVAAILNLTSSCGETCATVIGNQVAKALNLANQPVAIYDAESSVENAVNIFSNLQNEGYNKFIVQDNYEYFLPYKNPGTVIVTLDSDNCSEESVICLPPVSPSQQFTSYLNEVVQPDGILLINEKCESPISNHIRNGLEFNVPYSEVLIDCDNIDVHEIKKKLKELRASLKRHANVVVVLNLNTVCQSYFDSLKDSKVLECAHYAVGNVGYCNINNLNHGSELYAMVYNNNSDLSDSMSAEISGPVHPAAYNAYDVVNVLNNTSGCNKLDHLSGLQNYANQSGNYQIMRWSKSRWNSYYNF